MFYLWSQLVLLSIPCWFFHWGIGYSVISENLSSCSNNGSYWLRHLLVALTEKHINFTSKWILWYVSSSYTVLQVYFTVQPQRKWSYYIIHTIFFIIIVILYKKLNILFIHNFFIKRYNLSFWFAVTKLFSF